MEYRWKWLRPSGLEITTTSVFNKEGYRAYAVSVAISSRPVKAFGGSL